MEEREDRFGSAAGLEHARELSPLRKSTRAASVDELVREQLAHFSIDPESPLGGELAEVCGAIYGANAGVHRLWATVSESLAGLDRRDRVAWFNAKRFLCFQLAKLLDTLQNPLRKTWQSLGNAHTVEPGRGPYPLFDNVTAIFSATPVIARTATYLYACTEWVDDAFQGKELLHEIYSRLMNPTSVSLANQVVDLEAGSLASEYFAWNFNSGMAAIDSTFAHLVGYRDIVLSSRNIYGGAYQLIQDWYGKRSNLDVAVHWFDGLDEVSFLAGLERAEKACRERLAEGRHIYVYIESPCNPHGYVLDVPAICRAAHERGIEVICDSTVGTPVLQPVLRRSDPLERPDFVIHSYTKDLSGTGTVTAGVVIARNERMFIPKGESVTGVGPDGAAREFRWDETLFWNVYYVKGAFLDADTSFAVVNGMRTLEMRMLRKCIGTLVLARVLARHPRINVHCNAVDGDPNAALRERCLVLGLPAPLFTIDLEGNEAAQAIDARSFKRFFDCLEPAFGLQVSLGQTNTVVLCPALTSHSELSAQALIDAGITPSTIRIAVGDEDPRELLAHLMRAAELALEPAAPGFCDGFAEPEEIDALYRETYRDVHTRWVESRPAMRSLLL